jgi:hypothetical protein
MRVPLLGQQQQQPTQEQQEQMARMQIMQAVNEMASGMYVQLALPSIIDDERYVDVAKLRPLAKKCMIAAKAFFEGIGVIQFAGQNEQGD